MTSSTAVNLNTIYAIRNARGLRASEKVVLYTIESRGLLYTSAANTAQDAGMALSTFYDVVRSLKAKGLITTQRKFSKDGGPVPTRYRVNGSAVAQLMPQKDIPEPLVEEGGPALGAPPVGAAAQSPKSEGPPPVAGRTLLPTPPDKEDHEENQDKNTLKNNTKGADKDLAVDLATPSPGGSGCSTASLESSECRDIVEDPLDPFEINLVLDLAINAEPPVEIIRLIAGDNGEQQIVVAGQAPMTRSGLMRRLRMDTDLLRRVMSALPQDQLSEALRLGPDGYEMHRLEARLREMVEPIAREVDG